MLTSDKTVLPYVVFRTSATCCLFLSFSRSPDRVAVEPGIRPLSYRVTLPAPLDCIADSQHSHILRISDSHFPAVAGKAVEIFRWQPVSGKQVEHTRSELPVSTAVRQEEYLKFLAACYASPPRSLLMVGCPEYSSVNPQCVSCTFQFTTGEPSVWR